MQLLTLPKLAEQSGWPVSRIRRMVACRQLPHVRVGGRVLVPQNAINEFLNSNFVAPETLDRASAPQTD
jgi:excisionase family DNA binding protein